MTPIFTTSYEETHPDVLAIYCSDGRFTRAVEELARQLGDSRVDAMCLPGGPGLFDIWSSSPLEARLMDDAAEFLVVGHRTRKVLLVAHEGCGFYLRRYTGLTPEARRARQEEDVLHAAVRLRERHAGVDVLTYFATPEGSSPRVTFHEIRSR